MTSKLCIKSLIDEYQQQERKFHYIIPLQYRKKTQSKAFKDQIKQLDEDQKEQWFDHMYWQTYSIVRNQNSLTKARKYMLQLLEICRDYKLNLSKNYQFSQLIQICWLNEKSKQIQKLQKIYQKCGFKNLKKVKPKPSKSGCGCAGDTCQII